MNETAHATLYSMVQFRSRLEADWAASLHALNIEWKYEPRLVTLPSGEHYLPDFWLPQIGTWIEVKGDGVPRTEKAREFADLVLCTCQERCTCQWFGGQIVLIGHPALRTEGLRFGALYWEDARYASVLALCHHCDGHSWLRPRISLRCRNCGVLDPRALTMSGTAELEFRHADRIDPNRVLAERYAYELQAAERGRGEVA